MAVCPAMLNRARLLKPPPRRRHARSAASRALSQGLDYVFFAARQQLSLTRRRGISDARFERFNGPVLALILLGRFFCTD
jgi:hypothetical protein